MYCFLRKKREAQIREFMVRMIDLNNYMVSFPVGNEDSKLSVEELLDIAEFRVPAVWQKLMVMQGFDPVTQSPNAFIEFYERIKHTKVHEDNGAKPKTSSKNGHNDSKMSAKSTERGNKKRKFNNNEKWCELHQTYGHSTRECKVVLAQAKRMRATWEAGGKNNCGDGGANQHTKHNSKGKSFMHKELHKMVSDSITRAIKDTTSGKKCKKNVECNNIEDDDKNESSINLSAFTNLSVNSDTAE